MMMSKSPEVLGVMLKFECCLADRNRLHRLTAFWRCICIRCCVEWLSKVFLTLAEIRGMISLGAAPGERLRYDLACLPFPQASEEALGLCTLGGADLLIAFRSGRSSMVCSNRLILRFNGAMASSYSNCWSSCCSG